jgi:methylthioribose-1-phosphate isomerase
LPTLEKVCSLLAATRPTAVNLCWALERMKEVAATHRDLPWRKSKNALMEEAREIALEDDRINRTMGALGAELIPDGARVLTHCNAGALATGRLRHRPGRDSRSRGKGKKVRSRR